jgi:hypothetical protein
MCLAKEISASLSNTRQGRYARKKLDKFLAVGTCLYLLFRGIMELREAVPELRNAHRAKEVMGMAKPGYVMLRYSAPQRPEGVYERWYSDMTQLGQDMWPGAVAAGALSWKVLTDVTGNTPRNTMLIEFAHAEDAARWMASAECHSFTQRLTRIGTLDMMISAFRLHSQS